MDAKTLYQIREGWYNAVNFDHMPPELKELSDSRIDVCLRCPKMGKAKWASLLFFSVSFLRRFMGKADSEMPTKEEREGYICTECKCALSAKVKCRTCACPLGKW